MKKTLGLLALSLFVAACGDDDTKATSTPDAGGTGSTASALFIGQTQLTAPTSVAVLVGTTDIAVYICDGVSASKWFFGKKNGDAIDAAADDGGTVKATLSGSTVAGTVTPAGGAAGNFSISPPSGVGGLFLVQQGETNVKGFSATGGKITATVSADGATVSGSVERDGTTVPLSGPVQTFGEKATPGSGETPVATWIVQSDGAVRGRATKETQVSGTTGTGNCSIWSKIKSLAFGVDCSFF